MTARGAALAVDSNQTDCLADAFPGSAFRLGTAWSTPGGPRESKRSLHGSVIGNRENGATGHMAQTLTKNIWVTPEQWDRIEKIEKDRDVSSNRLAVELVMEVLDRRDWPRTESEIKVARASLFAAQVLARDLIAAGREHKVEEIRQFISMIVPEPDGEPGPARSSNASGTSVLADDPGPLGRGHAGLIESIFRYSWLLATLKRDEMLAEGRKAELDWRPCALASRSSGRRYRPAERVASAIARMRDILLLASAFDFRAPDYARRDGVWVGG